MTPANVLQVVPVDEDGAAVDLDHSSHRMTEMVAVKELREVLAFGIESAETRSVRRGELHVPNPPHTLGVADNCALLHLHEPGLLYNLRHRYQNNEIYTYTAMILIAINPYQQLPELYDDMERYRGKAIGLLPPHVYAVADRAHRCGDSLWR